MWWALRPRVLIFFVLLLFLPSSSPTNVFKMAMKLVVARELLQVAESPTSNIDTTSMGDSCSKDDIAVYQGAEEPLPNGIPTYTVQILNIGLSGCAVSDIHVSCGLFSSARLINPRIFRRIGYDDCLVNDGDALEPGESLSFQYANTYSYPLDVSSVNCYPQ